MNKRAGVLIAGAILVIIAGLFALWFWVTEPAMGRTVPDRTKHQVNPANLQVHVEKIVELGPRDYSNLEGLGRVTKYISTILEAYTDHVALQPYKVGATTYYNVTARFGPDSGPRIVLGAHYDTAGPLPGADDNASGVAGMLELGRIFKEHPPTMQVELVAYCLEEPPYFRTPSMGSAVHASRLAEDKVDVKVMFSLEMLGFYKDEPNSQEFPVSALKLFYPTVANFILVVGIGGQGGLNGRITRAMQAPTDLPIYALTAPTWVTGVDFSDHANYWNEGFDAVMVTDTSFYRNSNYHTEGDTPDTLDYVRMAKAVQGVYNAVLDLSQ